MAYEVVMSYHLHMPSYFLGTFTEYPFLFSIFNFRSLSYLAYLLQFFLVDNFDFSSVNGNQAFRSKL